MCSTPTAETNAFFKQQWETYRRVFSHNYMRHRELAGMVNAYLRSIVSKPYSLLDLGCGDAAFARMAAQGTGLASYIGIDLSPAALDFAREAMTAEGLECEFIETDISSAPRILADRGRHFDVVLASFSVHHLSREAKQRLLADVRQLLRRNGIFVMVDCVMRSSESRDQYLRRYLNGIRKGWTELDVAEIDAIEEHITSSDFPESCETLIQIADAVGCRFERQYVAEDYQDMLVRFHYD